MSCPGRLREQVECSRVPQSKTGETRSEFRYVAGATQGTKRPRPGFSFAIRAIGGHFSRANWKSLTVHGHVNAGLFVNRSSRSVPLLNLRKLMRFAYLSGCHSAVFLRFRFDSVNLRLKLLVARRARKRRVARLEAWQGHAPDACAPSENFLLEQYREDGIVPTWKPHDTPTPPCPIC